MFVIERDLYLLGICETQGQFIAMHTQLHRVTKRRKLLQSHLCTGYHTHVEEVLPKRSLAAHLEDGG